MNSFSKIRSILLLLGDVSLLYCALILTLILRYQQLFYQQFFANHLTPFTIIFGLWIIIFYVAGLYDFKRLKNDFEFKKLFWYTMLANTILAELFFYLLPSFRITPRASLAVLILIFGALDYFWRHLFNRVVGTTRSGNRLLLVGTNETIHELTAVIEKNPQLGYEIGYWMKEGFHDKEFEHFSQIILTHHITTLVIPTHLKRNEKVAKLIYKVLVLGIEVVSVTTLYESIFRKVPLAELEETWFLEHLVQRYHIYEIIRGPLERILALVFLLATSPFALGIALIIKLTSRGPVIFQQIRIGGNDVPFTIYKFRTMRLDAEQNGPQWAHYHSDPRATWFGQLLRRSHLDELPQLINILKGEVSFIGPRPERPEFVEELKKQLPYYELRHLAKPGITGWAQINYRYAASQEDAYQKLQYDLYYIKNNSPFLDFVIALKTLKFIIQNHV